MMEEMKCIRRLSRRPAAKVEEVQDPQALDFLVAQDPQGLDSGDKEPTGLGFGLSGSGGVKPLAWVLDPLSDIQVAGTALESLQSFLVPWKLRSHWGCMKKGWVQGTQSLWRSAQQTVSEEQSVE